MIFIPKQDPKQSSSLLIALLLLAIALYSVPSVTTILPAGVWQLSSVLVLTVLVFILARYRLTSYKYVIEDDLAVVKLQGAKEQRLCLLSMAHAKKLLTKEEADAFKGKCKVFNYAQNPKPNKLCRIYFDDTSEQLIVILEADEALEQYLKSKIG